jgi:hypothetical protein
VNPGWSEGEVVVERRFQNGRLRWALALRVVASAPDLHVLQIATGAAFARPVRRDGRIHRGTDDEWKLTPRVWTDTRVLVLLRPRRAHALWVAWAAGDDRFLGWYVNLQDPFQPDPLGFVTTDHALDIVVESDGTWRWKDEDEFAAAALAGRVDATAVRAEGERVLAEWPFPTGWEDFRPDPAWPPPELPEGYDDAPPSRAAR